LLLSHWLLLRWLRLLLSPLLEKQLFHAVIVLIGKFLACLPPCNVVSVLHLCSALGIS
jgi:hypothetical protein